MARLVRNNNAACCSSGFVLLPDRGGGAPHASRATVNCCVFSEINPHSRAGGEGGRGASVCTCQRSQTRLVRSPDDIIQRHERLKL